ncbi:metallophosphoesterase [Bacillus sp. N9]
MKRIIIITLILIIACYLFLHINNKWLQTTFYTIESKRIPQSFDGLTIVQLSDLHDATFGKQQWALINKVKKLNPDLIFLQDLIDSNRYDLENSLQLIKQLVTMTDVYYVTGNHEVAVNEVEQIKHELTKLGVHVMTNEAKRLTRNGEEIVLAGIDDPLMKNQFAPHIVVDEMIDQALTGAPRGEYTILLSHRPEVFDVYIDQQLDLVFTGHAHGGQLRLPGFGGLIAPGQGWFPSYTSGKHQRGITEMIINRGLGNSIFPYRIFNRPEIVVATLRHSS